MKKCIISKVEWTVKMEKKKYKFINGQITHLKTQLKLFIAMSRNAHGPLKQFIFMKIRAGCVNVNHWNSHLKLINNTFFAKMRKNSEF